MFIRDNKIQPLHCCVVNSSEGTFRLGVNSGPYCEAGVLLHLKRCSLFSGWRTFLSCAAVAVDMNIGLCFGRYNVNVTIISGLHIVLHCRFDYTFVLYGLH